MARGNFRFLRRQEQAVQIRRITDWNEEDFSAFLLNKGYDRGSAAEAAFGAYLEDIPVGAVELSTGYGYIELLSIIVDENRRQIGVGTALLEKAKEFAAEMDVDQIYVDFLNDTGEKEEVRSFFRANGFYLSENAGLVLTLCPAELLGLELFQKRKGKGKGLPKNVVHVAELSAEQKRKMERLSGRTSRGEGRPVQEDGRLQADLSLACVNKDEVNAFVVLVKRGGQLCLSAAYTDEAHIAAFLGMLSYALEGAVRRGVQELHVTVGESAFTGILEKITEERPELLRRREYQRMSWNLEDARMEMEARDRVLADAAAREAEDEMEILVPKLMRLMDILETEGIDCDLMLSGLPYVQIDGRIAVQYLPRDNTYDRFTLLFFAYPAGDLEPEELRDRCEGINMLSSYVTAAPSGRDLLLRFAALEYQTPIEEEAFLDYLDVFQRELFRAEMQMGEGK